MVVSFLLAAAVLLTGLTYTHPSALFAPLALTAPRGRMPPDPSFDPNRVGVPDRNLPGCGQFGRSQPVFTSGILYPRKPYLVTLTLFLGNVHSMVHNAPHL